MASAQGGVGVPTKDTGEAAPATVETTYPAQEDGSATANGEGTQPTVLSTYPAHPDDDVEEESDMDESRGVYKAVSRGGNDGPSTTAWVVPKAGNTRKAQQGMGQGSLPAMSNGTAEGAVVGPIGLAKSITFKPMQGFPRGEASASFMQHLREGHASYHPDCWECTTAKMQETKVPFGPSKGAQEIQEAGWRLAMDFKGPLKPDLYGNIWQQQIVETQSRYGGVYGLPSKHAEGSVKGTLLFLAELRRVSKSNMDIASVHSDGGTEFTGALSKYCLEHGIRKTDSGRYRPELNRIAENRIKAGYQRVRAMLGTCTGGADYYDELAGPALQRANFLINRVPWTTGTDPYKALRGAAYQRDSRDHIFGCLIAPLIPKEIRANSLAPVAKIGVYLGSSEKTPGAIILAPITFDYEHKRWVLHAPEEATSYKAFDSIFPLRLLPTAGGRTLGQFMEGIIPLHKQARYRRGSR